MSTIINIQEAKAHLSRIIDEVAAGAEVIIAKDGKPIAKLIPITPTPAPKKYGLLKGQIRIAADFDAPLDEETLAEVDVPSLSQ